MKIYRALIKFNNGDYDEWERWYTEASPWYTSLELAEKHIEKLKQFRDYFLNKHVADTGYECLVPEIEEHEVATEFVPMTFEKYADVYCDEFKPLEYIHYDGEYNITDVRLHISCYTSWYIWINIDGKETFGLDFNRDGNYQIECAACNDSKFYQYVESDKNKLLEVVIRMGNSIMAIYNDFRSKYDKLYAEYQKFNMPWDEAEKDPEFKKQRNLSWCRDPEYQKQKHLAWCRFKLEAPKAVYQLLTTFPFIKVKKNSLENFKCDIESGYFEEFPEYIEVVNELLKLSE